MTEKNEKTPGVSVYIIAYLATEERGRLLKSICENALELNYPEFEVVVSDNAGPISVEEALESINDPRLRIFRNERNLGFGGNFNMCLERCSYDIIKFNCDDDLLHPDFLKLTVPLVADDTFVVTDYEKYTIGNLPVALSEPMPETPDVERRAPGYRRGFWKPPYISLPGCTLFTRKLFESLGGYDTGSILPDWDTMIEAQLRKKLVHVKHTLCYMGEWEDSITVKARADKPYFFHHGWLYTKFRLFHHASFGFRDRMHLRFLLACEFGWQTLRAVCRLFVKNYRSGYGTYARKFLFYVLRGKKAFEGVASAQ